MSETLTVASLDGTASETITIAVTGTSSLATIAGDTAGAVAAGTTAGAGGTLLVSDADAGEAHFAAVDPAALAGTFGAFTFDAATGAWTYVLDDAGAATAALAGGEVASETLLVSSADGSASETIVVTVTGANDAAAITGSAAGAVSEAGGLGNAVAGVATTGGVLAVSDADNGEAAFAPADPASLAGTYGSFAFDAASGEWTYALDNARAATQALGAGVAASDTLMVRSVDGTAVQAITVAITGADDAATISGTASGAVTEDLAAVAGGQLLVSDPDAGEALFAAPVSLAGTYGSFAFDAASGAWSYALDNARAATQALAAGQVASETLTVQSLHGEASQAITVSVTGRNDAAVIGGTASGAVTEAATVGGVSQASGVLTISDVDSPASFAGGTYAGSFGSLSLDAGGAWTYSLNNANPVVDALTAGQSLADSVVVRAADGTTKAISIAIAGANEIGGGTLTGTAAAETLTGTGGNDQLFGLGGNDRLLAGDGNDLLDGGAGDDTLDGGNGVDTASYASATAGVTVNLGTAGAQNTGGAGKDTLIGIENLTGSALADTLTGTALANAIDGGAGDDRITGGGGADRLTGGLGRDLFVYATAGESTAAARDWIGDFTHLTDRFDLSGIDSNTTTNKNDTFLFGGATATSFGVWSTFEAATNTTHVLADTDGNATTAELWIDLAGNVALTQADFVL